MHSSRGKASYGWSAWWAGHSPQYRRLAESAGMCRGPNTRSGNVEHLNGEEMWHCPECVKNVRLQDVPAHLDSKQHLKKLMWATQLDKWRGEAVSGELFSHFVERVSRIGSAIEASLLSFNAIWCVQSLTGPDNMQNQMLSSRSKASYGWSAWWAEHSSRYRRLAESAGMCRGPNTRSGNVDHLNGEEMWHCPKCVKDVRLQDVPAHLDSKQHLKKLLWATQLDKWRGEAVSGEFARQGVILRADGTAFCLLCYKIACEQHLCSKQHKSEVFKFTLLTVEKKSALLDGASVCRIHDQLL